jgi:MFS family permease
VEPAPVRHRWWTLLALLIGVLVVGFDVTILNVAILTLAVDLDASTAELQWIVDAFIVVLAALLLPAGLLGDRIGRKKVLLASLAVFAVGCLIAAANTAFTDAMTAVFLGCAVLAGVVKVAAALKFPRSLEGDGAQSQDEPTRTA